jgi:predicted ester cyclase
MSETCKMVVRRLFDECLNGHQPDLYSQFYSEVVYRTPVFGELRGEEHRQFLLSVLIGFPDAHWMIEDQFAEQDRVVTRWTFFGTHKAACIGIEATGRQLHCSGISIHRIVDGKIAEEWAEGDTLGVMQQWELVPMETSIGKWFAPAESPVLDEWDSAGRL